MLPLLGRLLKSTAVRVLLSLAILAWMARSIDMTAAARAVAAIQLRYLAAVLLLVGVDRAVMIHRWVLLLRASDIALSTAEATRIFLVSSFVGSFLPAGVGGDAARAYSLRQANTEGGEAVASVVVDRLLGVLALFVMGVVGVALWAPLGRDWRVLGAGAVLVALSVAALWADRLTRLVVPDAHHTNALWRRVLRATDAVSRYRNRRGVLAHVLAWSLVVQLLRITQAYLLGLGLGLAVPFTYYLVFMPLGLLMLLLPLSVSGFGLPQGVIVWLLRPAGVPDAQSFALSTLIVLTGLAGNLPGLVLWLRKDRKSCRI